jgi:hypothetical protein
MFTRFALNDDGHRATLHPRCRPTTVLGTVRAIVVAPIKGVNRAGFFSHILQKSSKALSPAFTDGDTTSSVTRVSVILRIAAAILHHGIRSAQRVIRKTVSEIALAKEYCTIAAAALAFAIAEIAPIGFAFRTAIASAKPVQLPLVDDGYFANNQPFTESFAM